MRHNDDVLKILRNRLRDQVRVSRRARGRIVREVHINRVMAEPPEFRNQ
jgi:hypothetical protein